MSLHVAYNTGVNHEEISYMQYSCFDFISSNSVQWCYFIRIMFFNKNVWDTWLFDDRLHVWSHLDKQVTSLKTLASVLRWCVQNGRDDASLNFSLTFLWNFCWKVIASSTCKSEACLNISCLKLKMMLIFWCS